MQNSHGAVAFLIGLGLFCGAVTPVQAAETFDLSAAVVVVPKGLSGPPSQAVRMLVEEIEKRSQLRWTVTDAWPARAAAVVLVGPAPFADATFRERGLTDVQLPGFDASEGYRLRVVDARPPVAVVAGNDSRRVVRRGTIAPPATDLQTPRSGARAPERHDGAEISPARAPTGVSA